MAAVSGQYGKVVIGSSCIAEVDKWSADRECIVHDYATCTTPGNGGMGRLAGRRRHQVNVEGILDATSGNEIEDYMEEGDTVTLKLYYTATRYYTGSGVVESVNVPDVDIVEGAPVRWTSVVKIHGLLSKSSD